MNRVSLFALKPCGLTSTSKPRDVQQARLDFVQQNKFAERSLGKHFDNAYFDPEASVHSESFGMRCLKFVDNSNPSIFTFLNRVIASKHRVSSLSCSTTLLLIIALNNNFPFVNLKESVYLSGIN